MSASGQGNLQLQRVNGLPEAYSGVTTVWLLSTLGGSRNINTIGVKKKDIISVSIPKTCEALLQNKSDYTLRSASNLLYGVTVCYGRKTDYVLADVNSVKSQLQRQLYEATRKASVLSLAKVNHSTIFDGVHEYRNLREFQEMQSVTANAHDRRRRTNAILTDDPAFDINQTRDMSFLFGNKRPQNQSASLIHQRDILDELQNGYSYETGPDAGPHDPGYNQNRNFMKHPDFSSLDADLHLDFDDVLSEVEMGSTKARSVGSHDLSDRDDFDLLFGDDKVGETNHTDLPDLDLQISDQEQDQDQESERRPRSNNGNTDWQKIATANPSKRRKVGPGSENLLKLKIDDTIGLGNDILRENSGRYCELMDSKTKATKHQPSTHIDQNRWRSVLFTDEGPAFLRLCFEQLLLTADNDESFLEDGTSSLSAVERGRQRVRSLPPSRSSSSVASAERGRRMGPADLQRVGDDNNTNSFVLPDLHEIDENAEPEDYDNGYDGMGEDFMRIDLQLPPSSFGRSSSRTEPGSRDQIEELRRMHSERRTHRNNTLGSVEDVDESSADVESAGSAAREHTQNQILDNQTRRFYDYIFERASFVGKTTRSNPPFIKKLLFEDIIPSKASVELSSVEAGEGVNPVTKKMAANAFLSVLQLASRTYVDINTLEPVSGFNSMNGTDIVISV
ncbi:LAME_0B02916g1_1 [Lachancea meyersii CBS 8951]|uniref:LAME_0B02916g1_1 n=1 Tax=Lachancea meyersii CBS 8951 TaxID=1266667 RepID=A0A1G4IU05_9SACH|nr:LAME_0B02916g1_1 [Lachancea meyersii CBS 8951]